MATNANELGLPGGSVHSSAPENHGVFAQIISCPYLMTIGAIVS